MSDQAVADIKWLSDRLAGLIALGPELTTYSAMKQHTEELTSVVAQKRDEVTKLEEQVSDARKAITDLESEKADKLAAIDAEARKIVSDARAAAEAVTKEAQTQYETMKDDLEGKLLVVQNEVSETQKTLSDLRAAVIETQSRRDALLKELSDLKSRF